MNQLLLDLGNTRIKWLTRSQNGLGPTAALVHGDPSWLGEFNAALEPLAEPERIFVAAVAPELLTAAALRALAQRWPGVPLVRVQSTARLGRFVSAYAQPERLGVDRFLACTAAAELAESVLVLGCGTAFTADLIGSDGLHLGGMIAPSPETMRAAVLARTARVHWLREGFLRDFARNTEDALETGIWNAAAGMVERAIRSAEARLGARPRVLAHGGDAEELAAKLPSALQLDPLLLMRGLCLFADLSADDPRGRR